MDSSHPIVIVALPVPDESASPCDAIQLVSIVIPVFNEGAVLAELLARLDVVSTTLQKKYNFEFVLVDDGSTDETLAILKREVLADPRVRVIELRGNYGQTAALQAGFDAAHGNIIVTMDADLQHFPEDIPLFIDRMEAGCDLVCGWRHERREGVLRRWPSRAANYLIRRVSGLSVHDIGTTFRAYRKEIVDDLFLLGENHRFIPVFAKMAGARIEEVPINNVPRPVGDSNYGLGRTLNVFIDIFFLYFYTRHFDRPLRLFGKVSIGFAAIGGAISVWLLTLSWVYGVPSVRDHSGWFMLSMVLLLTSVQVMLVGFLAEVLARLYFQRGGRTKYRVRHEWIGSKKN